MSTERKPTISIIFPVYNEGDGLLLLNNRLSSVVSRLISYTIEIVFVDDHSDDNTPQRIEQIAKQYDHFRYIRLASNSGSHIAVLAGLEQCSGDCAIFLSADLQDPPELMETMLDRWVHGFQIIWAVRNQREGISVWEHLFSTTFYTLLIKMGGLTFPRQGFDFALLDRKVINALILSSKSNPSLMVEIARLGFKQCEIPYIKEKRQFGATKWTYRKKLIAFADAFVTFSYVPLRAMSYFGFIFSLLGFLYAFLIMIRWIFIGLPVQGWASLMVVVLVTGGLQMIMLGILGEYLWRTLEAARRRPLYNVESCWHFDSSANNDIYHIKK